MGIRSAWIYYNIREKKYNINISTMYVDESSDGDR